MKIEKLLENYELYKNELEADLYLLQMMLQQNMPDASGDTVELGKVLKHLKGCADFVNDAAVDNRLQHAEMRFRQLSYLEWLIKSLPNQEREILSSLILIGESWENVTDRLYISRATLYRLKQKATESLEQKVKQDPAYEDLFQDENV
jgi:DNA-directed RNA polymerase specialized sigma subunit